MEIRGTARNTSINNLIMKKILCPTDFSETAHTAIAYAAKLARAINAELTLLNVQSLFEYTPVELVRGKEMTIAGAAERLEAQSREVSRAFKISCYAEVEPSFSKLSTIITRKAKQFDLVVMAPMVRTTCTSSLAAAIRTMPW